MRKVLIKDVGKVITGNTPSKKNAEFYDSDDIGFVKPDGIAATGVTSVNKTKEYISENARKKARVVQKGTVLVTCIGNIGKMGIVENEEMAFNQQINAIFPNDTILSKYLAYNILSNKKKLEAISNAPVVPIINKTQFENFEITIHEELNEQEKIISILDKLTSIIENRNKQLEEYDQLIKSRFVEMFGDTVINENGWNQANLSDYISFLTSGSRGWSKYFVDSGEMFLTIKNVKNNGITTNNIQYVNAPNTKEADRTRVQEGDLLISITADLGRTGVVTKLIEEHGAYINQHLSLIRLDLERINPMYLSHFLESPSGQRQFDAKNQKGVKAGLNFDAIRSLQILVPPLELQTKYIDFIEHIDKLKFEVQKSLDETQLLFDSLMQEYFG